MAGKRDKVRMISTAGTGHFYTTDKNKKNTPGKMEFSKYDPVVRKHVPYKEGKIKCRPWSARWFKAVEQARLYTPCWAEWPITSRRATRCCSSGCWVRTRC
ncbi:hypothetical protein G6F65_012911 [Rhizopus arrhizus]|nr:hypothetical protein G6F65_012911 [Rhizopus arrhizus]